MKRLVVFFIAIAFFATVSLISCGPQEQPKPPAPKEEAKPAPAPEKPADKPAPAPAAPAKK